MKIKVRQICFILIAYTVAARLLQYPTLLSEYSGRDLILSALIDFAVQTVVIWAVAYLCSRTDKTFFGLLEGALGRVAARIIIGLFGAFFILASFVPLYEQKLYVHATFYDTVPSLYVFLPIIFFTIYAGAKSFTNIGRSADICAIIFALSFIFILAMSLSEVDFTNLLPIAKTGAGAIFGGALKSAYRFVEPAYLLMFMGRFEYKKGDAAKITLSYALGALIVMAFLAIFYGIYADIAPSRQFAISKTSLYFSAIDMIGRVDLIALYALEIVMLFAIVLNLQLAVNCIEECLNIRGAEWLSLAVTAALTATILIFNNHFNNISNFFADWMWIVTVVFATLLPLCAHALPRRKNEN